MNKKNLALIECLRKNSREKLTNISKITKIPVSTLFDTLNDMKGDVIRKHTVLLDFAKLGYHTHAHVFIKIGTGEKDLFLKHMKTLGCVNSVYKINDGWNFIIETVHRNVSDLDQFIESLKGKFNISDHKIHYLIDELKREEFEFN